MSALASPFVTYLWHYLLARLIYDGLIRPLAIGAALAVCVLILMRRRVR